ncbi:MAG: 30S ribosome-binding factor RbfA [Chloroflexi bacterium]|nr:30S ribosome-binding factor RbfA [Chloroflexota bacterium]
MPSEVRLHRISDRIKRELSEMLIFELSDPRIKGIFITDVNIDRELAFANIYISAIEGSERAKEALAGFNNAGGYIRRNLAKRVTLRSFPQLRFHWDPTPEKADQIEGILAEIRTAEEEREENNEKAEE